MAERGLAAVQRSKLFLIFRVGDERFALDAMDVVQVLPRLALKPVPQAPHWVCGVFSDRGQVVPVIDISALTFGQPAAARTSTRLVLVHYQLPSSNAPRHLGLILEYASETRRCDPAAFKPYGLSNRQTPYLGPVLEDETGLLQWITVQELLDPRVRELLFDPALVVSE